MRHGVKDEWYQDGLNGYLSAVDSGQSALYVCRMLFPVSSWGRQTTFDK